MATDGLQAISGHIVLCGLNELGYRTLEELRRLGEEVVVVALGSSETSEARRLDVPLIEGNYREERVLERAGVDRAAAIVIAEDDDVGNVHAALTAQDLNPNIRIGLRMFNPELGERVTALFRECVVLDPAAIAAPAFVAAALHDNAEQQIRIAGRTLEIREGAPEDPGVILPLADSEGTGELFPSHGRDLMCLAWAPRRGGREATLRELRGLGARVGARRWLDAAIGAVLATDRRLRVLAVILLGLTLVSVALFSTLLHLDLVDAVYFTVTIITTTGFGDISLLDKPEPLQIYGIALMILGASLLAILFALMTDVLVGARLAREFGGLPRRVRDHVIVCGLGNIGYRVVEGLVEEGVRVVAAEAKENARFLPAARALGVPVLVADARLTETLEALHVADARCLVIVTNDDLANLETALNARTVNPDLRVVMRLFDPDLAVRVERAFGIHISRSPSALAAPAFAAAAEGRHVLATIPLGVQALVVARTEVEEGSAVAGMDVATLERTTEARVLVLSTGHGEKWRPTPATRLAPGDALTIVATRTGLGQVVAMTETVSVG